MTLDALSLGMAATTAAILIACAPFWLAFTFYRYRGKHRAKILAPRALQTAGIIMLAMIGGWR